MSASRTSVVDSTAGAFVVPDCSALHNRVIHSMRWPTGHLIRSMHELHIVYHTADVDCVMKATFGDNACNSLMYGSALWGKSFEAIDVLLPD